MYFVLAVSTKHIYGILGNGNANTAQVFIQFLDNILNCRQKLFKMKDENTLYVMDKASIHETKEVDKYANEKKISLLTILFYSPALNGADTVIQAIKLKINKHRSQGK